MALDNIYERRHKVAELIKSEYLISDLKQIAREFKCSYTTILADIAAINNTKKQTIYPSAKTKNIVLNRDNYTCQYCGNHGEFVDHVISSFVGGVGYSYNLVACCGSCNSKKKKKTWVPNNIDVLEKENKQWADKIKEAASFVIPNIINLSVLASDIGISRQLLEYRIRHGLTLEQKEEIKNIFTKYLTNLK